MLQVARLAPRLLGESSALVADFLKNEITEDGGFRDRSGKSDLYYTAFGIDCFHSLAVEPPVDKISPYLDRFLFGENPSLVDIACFARARAGLGAAADPDILKDLDKFRESDGGFGNADNGISDVYSTFLALGALQDGNLDLPPASAIAASLKGAKTPDGGYANAQNLTEGSTPATAAAMTILRNYSLPPDAEAVEFLFSVAHPQGGFRASPRTPAPDLLSTAVALHALSGARSEGTALLEKTLDFVDSLWVNRGGFYGHWADEKIDCEYTFYALLALGHLSVQLK